MSFLPVIMAGGTGSRLWPLSREYHPKQFLSVEGKLSIFLVKYYKAISFTFYRRNPLSFAMTDTVS